MKILTLFYLFLYVSHIFLGPYYFWFLFAFKKIKWISKTWSEVFTRAIWITYIGFLSLALFNEYPNTETFLIAFSLSFASSYGYYIKFKDSSHFYTGIIDHVIYLLIPSIYLFFHYNIKLSDYNPTIFSLIFALYFFNFRKIDQILYQTGKDL